jgi:uncharacterized membrane protein
MLITQRLKKLNINYLILIIFIISLLYSFTLALKRYNNFELGKFDLGNMSQMVWNSSRGNFMEITDQFGNNMPRWGMSHVDPVLLFFVPIYWINSHPMIMVFFQHLLILSAIFPLFWLVTSKLNSKISGVFVVLTYVLYPAIGFTLVWTGYHGISFVAPVLIWLIWYLEKTSFLKSNNKKYLIIYWVLIVFMLLGKEEIGFMLALTSIYIYLKNKKLGILTFVISFLWSALCFLIIIPSYAGLRKESIDSFILNTQARDVKTNRGIRRKFLFTKV